MKRWDNFTQTFASQAHDPHVMLRKNTLKRKRKREQNTVWNIQKNPFHFAYPNVSILVQLAAELSVLSLFDVSESELADSLVSIVEPSLSPDFSLTKEDEEGDGE